MFNGPLPARPLRKAAASSSRRMLHISFLLTFFVLTTKIELLYESFCRPFRIGSGCAINGIRGRLKLACSSPFGTIDTKRRVDFQPAFPLLGKVLAVMFFAGGRAGCVPFGGIS